MKKLYELAEKINIERETEKAVFIKSREMSKEDYDFLTFHNSICKDRFYQSKTGSWVRKSTQLDIKGNGFWLPKSQIEIADNKVISITKWLYRNLTDSFWDCPLLLQEEKQQLIKENQQTKTA